MILSKSFALEDFTRSATAQARKIDNTPSPEIVERLKLLAAVLERLQSLTGLKLSISSGYRSPALNVAVGGVATSGHCKGFAVDIESPTVTVEALQEAICKSGIKYDQCILETAGARRWVHFSIDPRFRMMRLKIAK